MRTFAYIDGFNLYYSVRGLGLKWLNIAGLVRAMITPAHDLQRVNYYTARVSGAADPGAPRRQQIYLNALTTTPEVVPHFGSFFAKTKWRPVVNLPVEARRVHGHGIDVLPPAGVYQVDQLAGDPNPNAKNETLVVGHYRRNGEPKVRPRPPPADALLAEVFSMEEKGSDVNLACHLVHDAHLGKFDVAAVLTNDSDLEEPIRIVTQELGKQVLLLSPPRDPAHKTLARVASDVLHVRRAHFAAAQFPDRIVRPGGTVIEKPWP